MSGLGAVGAFPLYMVETLIWTGVLIAAVLILRRPVARWFGPQMAYALWAIPALRLIVPPVELPAWMRPAEAAAVSASLGATTEAAILPLSGPALPIAVPEGVEASAPVAQMPWPDIESIFAVAMAVWLTGAAIFLFMRFAAYFRLRDELLAGARDVGCDGGVRLIETPGTLAPLAFGVIDKVVALPIGFMAQHDRTARDLALAHEMAHHRGRDLLINVLVQPLFALHWFNPLSRYGWLALRRDQEAACDARVIASHPQTMREAYANLIVSFAAAQPGPAPQYALAAPMACPVLGEKSIIHRLRSLKMNDTSNRRRIAGRLMLGAAVIALPLTASISYAASKAPQVPEAPQELASPAAPAPPAPSDTTASEERRIEHIIIGMDPETTADSEGQREERVFIFRSSDDDAAEEGSERRVMRWIERDGEGESDSAAEGATAVILRMRSESGEASGDWSTLIERSIRSAEQMRAGNERQVILKVDCDRSSDQVASAVESNTSGRVVMMCQSRVAASAREGLERARAEIANDSEIPEDVRARILSELDRQIENWDEPAR